MSVPVGGTAKCLEGANVRLERVETLGRGEGKHPPDLREIHAVVRVGAVVEALAVLLHAVIVAESCTAVARAQR
jgi:hypothetical protein